ncbi:hypothetical protein Moror_4015 [Moniliophthora roreri MCA 2997]|uniref:Uncharacterized protein n=1 Tax=Moniliophthora roreri (strain MCA 2997) TaxID=1381753 RepID=V2XND8_MONRO|nr:hypothetical protein Moror_4015 [Moniliophthora roreri MCA 2997]
MISLSVLSYLIPRRVLPGKQLRQWRHAKWGKICLFLVLVGSWLFVLCSGIIVLGLGTTGDPLACSLAVSVCSFLQGGTKFLIYALLVEKAYIVWSNGYRTPRFKTKVYRVSGVALLGQTALWLVFILLWRASNIRVDGVCIIGYSNPVAILLSAVEFIQNVTFTIMFVWPLWRSDLLSPRLREVARKTFYGSVARLIILSTNACVLHALHGKELVWVCMSACVTDVTLNAMIMYWISSGVPSDFADHPTLPEIPITNIITIGGDQEKLRSGTDHSDPTATLHLASVCGRCHCDLRQYKMGHKGDEEKGYTPPNAEALGEDSMSRSREPSGISAVPLQSYRCRHPHPPNCQTKLFCRNEAGSYCAERWHSRRYSL